VSLGALCKRGELRHTHYYLVLPLLLSAAITYTPPATGALATPTIVSS
jgi:hypothetical protein